ncbi:MULTISPECIES: glycosyltransferase [unclassified Psychrobacter]|uniref:glycosyltransferase n=1 Tax=unclassified Psychrobacter TaxID=196806 RepID=UPI0004AE12C0|nr:MULTISPECIES: glycosyltransferase [unclassified Psychrobacter]
MPPTISTIDNHPQPSVAILYIATGRYTVFWDYFYKSAEKYLLPNCDKHYVLFTDNIELLNKQSEYLNVSMIKQEALQWPYIALMRYQIFLNARQFISSFDFSFYFNGNTEFLDTIFQEDLLPLKDHEKLTLYLQPHVFHRHRRKYPYDRNPQSQAYIPYNQGRHYFAGGILGGKTNAFLELCELLNAQTETDLKNNIIALWHDESYLNKFALGRADIKILPPYFTRGEREYWKKTSKLMFSDKSHYRFGGHSYLRGETNNKITQAEWKKNNGRRKRKLKTRFRQYIASLFFRQ